METLTPGTVERAEPTQRPPAVARHRRPLPLRLLDRLTLVIDRTLGWWRLPKLLGLAVLVGLRNVMRHSNLFDSGPGDTGDTAGVRPPAARYLTERTPDGSYNDLSDPRMGVSGSRFGRNMAPDPPKSPADLLSPNPREVSRSLLTRHEFQPATTVNALSAAWLQFMVRDWFHHERGDDSQVWDVPLPHGDDWPRSAPKASRRLRIPRVPGDATGAPGYRNVNSHWWDASQLYGNDRAGQERVRTGVGGKLKVPARGELPAPAGTEAPAEDPGYWLGLAMLQILFIREHNAICDRLRADRPTGTDEELFQRARLVNAALIAKIHMLEWTPAMIDRPTTVAGMSAIWYGMLGRRVHRLFGRVSGHPGLSGIVGGPTDHFGVPFSITEEFSAVYRMHSLMPDEWTFYAAADGTETGRAGFRDLTGARAADRLGEHPLGDLFYSFGVAPAGALTLNNFPRFMQEFHLPDGRFIDLAATDILRIRELGVPRYNEFRRRLHLRPKAGIGQLTANRRWAEEIGRIYGGDIERVDLMVGLLAEQVPSGFAFSDTAFRIFLLMASRRLNSDRFFTTHYTPEVYTRAGLDWVEHNTMVTVLLRHLPELRPALRGQRNAFAPFPVDGTRPGA